MRYAAMAVMAMAMGCGPSVSEIRRARDATYAMDAARLMQVAMEVASNQVGIADADLSNHAFVTKAFLTWDGNSHLGWPARCSRGAWRFEIQALDHNRSSLVVTPLAQASLTVCNVRWTGGKWTPSWVDVDPDAVGLRPTLENGAAKMEVAIYERATR